MNNKNMIRMEKKAANKVGLIIILVLAIVAIAVGGYLLYENKDNLDFSLPWEKNEEVIPEEEPPKKDENNTSDGKLYLPGANEDANLLHLSLVDATVNVKNLQATKQGYEFDFVVNTNDYDAEFVLICSKILVDGYEVSPTFTVDASFRPNMKKTAHVVIPIAELENLEIRNFRALSFFVHVDYMYKGSPVEVDQILVSTMIQEVYVDNNKEELASFAPQENVRISYHKKIEAEDATYLYFVINNTNDKYDFDIELKKTVIDDEIYNNIEVNAHTHHQSKNVFFIKLPKKEFKKPKKITLAFMISRVVDGNKYIYFTRDETIELTK